MTDHDASNEEPLSAPDDDLAADITEADLVAEAPVFDGTEPADAEMSDDDALPTTTEPATEPETKTVYRGSGVRWGFVTGLLLAVLLVILVFQNTDPVSFRFLIWEIETPLAALLIATAVVAAVADELVGLVVRARRRRRLAEKEELAKLRQQNHS